MIVKYWVVWGIKYVPQAIKVTGGTLAHCRREVVARKAEGWIGLAVYAEGTPYPPETERYLLRTPEADTLGQQFGWSG